MNEIDADDAFVIPLKRITVLVHPLHRTCGLAFEDSEGQRFLIPIPGSVLLGLAKEIQEAAVKMPGLSAWESMPASRR